MSRYSDSAIIKGKELGFDEVEVYFSQNSELELGVFEGVLDKYSKSKVRGMAIRGIKGGKTGFAYTEKIDARSVEKAVEAAYENMKHIDSADETMIYDGDGIYHKQQLYGGSFNAADIKQKADLLFEMEKIAYASTDRIHKINYLLYGETENEEHIDNSLSLSLSEKRDLGYAYMSIVIKDGDKFRTGKGYKVARDISGIDAAEIVSKALEDGLSKTGAKSVRSGNYPVIFRNTSFADLLGAYSGLFIAERVQKGTSKLKGMLGQKIASEILTITDDPYLEQGMANAGFDAEGVAAQSKKVIKNGELMTYLYNIKTAIKDGVKSTGNAGRGSYKSPIGTTVYNFYVEPGARELEEGIEDIKKGILITDLQGLHSGINPISCDFSLAAQGFMIEDGRISYPVADFTVAGNFLEIIKRIRDIFNDLEFGLPSSGYFGSPSVEIESISISGENASNEG